MGIELKGVKSGKMTGKEHVDQMRKIRDNLKYIWHSKKYSVYYTFKIEELKYRRGDL